MGPRDEYRSAYPDSTKGLRWALALVSVIAVAAVIAAVTLWLNPRHIEQAPPSERTEQAPPTEEPSTGVPRTDLEQITAQELRLQFPGPPVRITCPPGNLPAEMGASVDCVLKRSGDSFRLTLTVTGVRSPTDAIWNIKLGEKI